MRDSVNADDNRKEKNNDQTFFDRKALKSLKVYNDHHSCNEKNESVYGVRSNRGME